MSIFDEVIKELRNRGRVWGPNKGGEFTTFCIFHLDQKRPNLRINPERGFYCSACGVGGSIRRLAEKLGIKVDGKGITLNEFAEAKGLSTDFLQDLGWVEIKLDSKSVLKIPYLDEEGEICATRFRHSLDGNLKFSWKKGNKPLPYGLQRLRQAREQGYIVIVEGETDAIALWQNDFPALGIPGATVWKKQWADYVKGLRVYIWQEPDEAGKRFVKDIAESVGECWVIEADEVKDTCELYGKHPEDFVQRFQSALDRAGRYEETTKALTEEEMEKVKPLLNEPHLLRRFIEEIANSGVIGEEKLAGILTLILESRKTDRPINAGIISPSSSGKNHLLKAVLERFPEESYVCHSGGSERSFIFSDEDLENRFLIFNELRGYSAGETGKALLHSLTWDNKVDYEVTIKQKDGQYKTNKINKLGPTGLLFTSVDLRGLDEELKNRLFIISTQPGEAKSDLVEKQTQSVLYSIADRLNGSKSLPSDTEGWKALFQILMEPAKVEIPWGRWLVDRLDTSTLAIRRKFELFLYFAYSSALLHRFHRKGNGSGKIVADTRDYANAWALVGQEFEAAQKEGVSAKAREIAELVKNSCSLEKGSLSVKKIAETLNISPQAVHKHLNWLDSEGYVSKISGGKGKAAKVMPGESLPEEPEPLPRPEELASDFPELGGEWKDPVSGEEVWFGDNRLDDETLNPEDQNDPGRGGDKNVRKTGFKVETEAKPASEKFKPREVETGLKFKLNEERSDKEEVESLNHLKPEGVETSQLQNEGSLNLKPEKSEPSPPPPPKEDFLQQKWRRMSIPQWKKILAEAIGKGDMKRANYARWMLHEVLGQSEEKDDPERGNQTGESSALSSGFL